MNKTSLTAPPSLSSNSADQVQKLAAVFKHSNLPIAARLKMVCSKEEVVIYGWLLKKKVVFLFSLVLCAFPGFWNIYLDSGYVLFTKKDK